MLKKLEMHVYLLVDQLRYLLIMYISSELFYFLGMNNIIKVATQIHHNYVINDIRRLRGELDRRSTFLNIIGWDEVKWVLVLTDNY